MKTKRINPTKENKKELINRKKDIDSWYQDLKNQIGTAPEEFTKFLLSRMYYQEGKDYEREVKIGHRKYRLDFLFEEKKKGIEVQGTYWHGKKNIIENDFNKWEYFKKKGYNIFYIYEDEVYGTLRDLYQIKKLNWRNEWVFIDIEDTNLYKNLSYYLSERNNIKENIYTFRKVLNKK